MPFGGWLTRHGVVENLVLKGPLATQLLVGQHFFQIHSTKCASYRAIYLQLRKGLFLYANLFIMHYYLFNIFVENVAIHKTLGSWPLLPQFWSTLLLVVPIAH